VLVAREGDPVPGAPPGTTFVSFSRPSLNDAGELAFHARVADASGERDAFLGPAQGGGGLTLLARVGDPAPGAPGGAPFASLEAFSLALNGLGELAFAGVLSTDGTGIPSDEAAGIWGPDGSGQLTRRLAAKEPVTGAPPGVVYLLDRPRVALDDDGQLLLWPGSGDLVSGGEAVVGPVNGELALIARSFDAAPGVPGAHFVDFGAAAFLGGGSVALLAEIECPPSAPVGSFICNGLWRSDGAGDLDVVAATSLPAPPFGEGLVGVAPNGRLETNRTGQLVFLGVFGIDYERVLLSGPGDALEHVSGGEIVIPYSQSLNDEGHLLLFGATNPPPVEALVRLDALGAAVVAATDQTLEVDAGAPLGIDALYPASGNPLSESDEVVLEARLDDHTEAVVRVPEPSRTLLLAAGAAVALAARALRRKPPASRGERPTAPGRSATR
jgi:hypothetical protein